MSGGPCGRGKAPERTLMPLRLWPAEDREIWERALAKADPFADSGGERAGFRTQSNRRLRDSYGRWLTHLKRAGCLDSSSDPADRIHRDTVDRYARELQAIDNLPSTIALRLTDLVLMARLFDTTRDWSFITRLAKRIYATGSRPRKDKRALLRGSHELLALGVHLMAEAETHQAPAASAVHFRDGLIIALLTLVPLRRKNVVQLRLGIELRQEDGRWMVEIPGNETKTHEPLNFEWPDPLLDALDNYLQHHRPVLAARSYRWPVKADERLWVAQSGSALTEMALYDIVRKRTKAAFGVALNPHAFRDAAATTLAIHDPEHVRVAASVLGHRSFSTTEKYYIQAQSLEAHRHYISALYRLRRS